MTKQDNLAVQQKFGGAVNSEELELLRDHRLGCRGSRPGARSRCESRRLHSHVCCFANIVPGSLRGPGGNRRGQHSHCVHDYRHA